MQAGAVDHETGLSAITVLERHHRRASMLFGEITGLDRPSKARADLCKALAAELTTHLLLDERHVRRALSPTLRADSDVAGRDRRLAIEQIIADLARINASPLLSLSFLASVRARVEAYFVDHQHEVLRALRACLSDAELGSLGDALQSTARDLAWGPSPMVLAAPRIAARATPARRAARVNTATTSSRRLVALAG